MITMPRLLRVTVADLALMALGGWSVWAQLVYRTPSRYVTMVIAGIAVASMGMTLAFWLRTMFRGMGATDRQLSRVAVGKKLCALTTLAFSFYGLFLFTNGRFDIADPVHYSTEIVGIGMDETELGVRVPFIWADVRSWRRSGEVERILLRRTERERLWAGQAVMVSIRPGFYGVPWVSRIEADVERRSQVILGTFPGAGQVRKDLAEFYVRLGRFTDAAVTAREYAQRFPHDRDFPVSIAKQLTSRDRFADVVTVLADVASRHEDANVYMLLGYSLGMQGRRAEGLPLLERARAMQPSDWWPHYALGWVYAGGGQYAHAVASFEKAIALRPGLYDVRRELQRLRPLVAQSAAQSDTRPAVVGR
jgi:Flp pilus assembly protein TadD